MIQIQLSCTVEPFKFRTSFRPLEIPENLQSLLHKERLQSRARQFFGKKFLLHCRPFYVALFDFEQERFEWYLFYVRSINVFHAIRNLSVENIDKKTTTVTKLSIYYYYCFDYILCVYRALVYMYMCTCVCVHTFIENKCLLLDNNKTLMLYVFLLHSMLFSVSFPILQIWPDNSIIIFVPLPFWSHFNTNWTNKTNQIMIHIFI